MSIESYGIMSVAKTIIPVIEELTENSALIEECNCGKWCEPGEYV